MTTAVALIERVKREVTDLEALDARGKRESNRAWLAALKQDGARPIRAQDSQPR